MQKTAKAKDSQRIKELRFIILLLRENPLIFTGLLMVIIVLAIAIITPIIVPYSTNTRVDYINQRLPPSSMHILGTDEMGRDLLRVIFWGATIDLSAVAVVLSGALAIAIPLGSIAGYIGGKVDEVIMRFTDIFLAFPPLILAMAIAAVVGRSFENLLFSITIVYWSDICRLIRGQVLGEKEKTYVEALRASGVSHLRIIVLHILPNTFQPILIQITFKISWVILAFAGLNFLGFGPGPFTPEWGQLISNGHTYFFQAPHIVIFSGIAILFTSLGFNLLGDGLRDVLDPKLRR